MVRTRRSAELILPPFLKVRVPWANARMRPRAASAAVNPFVPDSSFERETEPRKWNHDRQHSISGFLRRKEKIRFLRITNKKLFPENKFIFLARIFTHSWSVIVHWWKKPSLMYASKLGCVLSEAVTSLVGCPGHGLRTIFSVNISP